MIKITNVADCCGCSACASICAHNAIDLVPNPLGFLYPQIDLSKCVNCGLCEKVCQFNANYDKSLNMNEPVAYAARHKDINEVMKSRSGAAFVVISNYVLEHGGVVYGAGFKDHFRVVHKRATTKDERDEFRGSKYVQSDLRGVFFHVKEDLNNGLDVLFSGTPCQTAGLNAFVGKKLRDRLLLIDIVCHGVPGPFVWRDYIDYLEKKQGSRILYVNFRDKEKYGWTAHRETFVFEKDKDKKTFSFQFYQPIYFRPSCGCCHFTNMKRPSDITIADYWGWERTDSTINADDKGCSLVLCNTFKGLKLFESLKDNMNTIPAELKNVIQTHLYKPLCIHPKRELFEVYYMEKGFKYAIKKTGLTGFRFQVNTFLSHISVLISKINNKIKSRVKLSIIFL